MDVGWNVGKWDLLMNRLKMDQAGLGNKMAHWMGKGMVFILLWFAFLKLPLLSSAEPMPSWESVLAYAFQQKWQWGVEVVFT
ncbi:MAG TPA: hypothetical protein VF607_16040, partial [Verrucomicrobiae bacterium]